MIDQSIRPLERWHSNPGIAMRPGPLFRTVPLGQEGGTQPPKRCSSASAAAIVRWSLPSAAATWTPSGSPRGLSPSGTCVTGRPSRLKTAAGVSTQARPIVPPWRGATRGCGWWSRIAVVAEDRRRPRRAATRAAATAFWVRRGRHVAVQALERERDQDRHRVVAAPAHRVHPRARAARLYAGVLEQLVERRVRAVAERGEVDLERAPELLERHALAARAALLEGTGGVRRAPRAAPCGRGAARRRRRAGRAACSGRRSWGRRARARRSARRRRPGRR